MSFKFVSNLSEKEYTDFLKKQQSISYKKETSWSNYNNQEEVLYVGVTSRKKVLVAVKIEIVKKKNDIYYYIPGGPTIDYNDKELLIFLIENIKFLAKVNNAYCIKMDEISEIENAVLKSIGFKFDGKTNYYSITSLTNNGKLLTQKFFEKTLDLPDIKRSGIFFETITAKKQCKELDATLSNWFYKCNYDFEQLLSIYKKKVMIITEKIDLVFYLNTLRDTCAKDSDIIMAEELIKECGDELILGFAILLLPANKDNIFCIEMKDNGAFPKLNITNQLLFEIIKTGLSKKYNNIICSSSIKNYNIIEFNYNLVINNWKYLKHKIVK
jgi:Uncharacterized protein involved in methicillin resistance